jgi:hypothetical protein
MADALPTQRALARLLRFALASAPLSRVTAPDGELRLVDAAGSGRPVSAALLAEALRRGLMEERDGRLHASVSARAFLRRAAADEEEEAYSAQHRELVSQTVPLGTGRERVRRNLLESPLGPLSRLKERDGSAYFPPDAIAAGERFASEFERAGLQPRITSTWEPRLSQAPRRRSAADTTISDSAAAARHRFGRVLDALGPELSGVALDVCCFGKGLELVERERRWPARSAKLMLRTALTALARHYAPPPTRPRSRHWGTEDYRPEMS